MDGEYCLNWTAWRVWTHPHKAFRAIGEATLAETNLESRLKEAMELADRHRQECVRLTDDMTRLNRRLIDAETELAQTRRELDDVRRELAEHESVDQKLEEFSRMLTKVEEMKKGYEKRISTLEARLRDARTKLGKEDNYDLFESIDMKAEADKRTSADERRRKALVESDDNWAGGDGGRKKSETGKRAPGLPEEFPRPEAPDDWLLALPDSL